MAKSSKTKTDKSKIEETATDAVEVSAAEGKPTVEATDVDAASDIPDDEDGLATDTQTDLDMEIVEDPVEEDPVEAEPAQEPVRAASIPVDDKSSAGFFPLLLGGVAAGAIGYGIATYFPMTGASDELATQVSAQADQIAALEAELAATPAPDLSGIETQIAQSAEQSTIQIGALSTTVEAGLADLDARLVEVEKRPSADGTLSETALAAYQRELEELRAELDAQKDDVMSAAAQAEADLATARAEAAALEQEALAAAQNAAARAALNRIATAVETGAPFGDALSDLDGSEIPVALSEAAQTGVATTAQLTEAFPSAARAALATARSEGVSDDAAGLGGFFRSQFDVRSTAPQEGSGPDAVLSRAEAAMKEGRVSDALAEIEALPEVARAELTDWTAKATERADVLDAIAILSETYN